MKRQLECIQMVSCLSHLVGYAEYMEAAIAIDSRLTDKWAWTSMDETLKGTNGRKSYQSSSTNAELSGTRQVEEEPTDGSDVHLTFGYPTG